MHVTRVTIYSRVLPMAVGTKRRRPPAKGLLPGERLRRDKLAGSELHSQWGWVSWISDPSMITSEHLFTACGFNNTSEKPICKNKYSDGREPKEGNVGSTQDPKPTARGDEEDIIIVSSDDEEPYVCTKGRCKENPQCLNHLGQAKLENQGEFSHVTIILNLTSGGQMVR